MWLIEVNEIAERAILKLDKPVRERIFAFLHDRVESSEDPTVLAEPLKGEFHGLWRSRWRLPRDLRYPKDNSSRDGASGRTSPRNISEEWTVNAAQE